MKLRLEIDPDRPEEVVIYSHSVDERVRRLQEAFGRELATAGELALKNGDEELYIPHSEILFFETADNRVWAHTAADCYSSALRLTELEELLPRTFARASKGCIINTAAVRSLKRSPAGVAAAGFSGSAKVVYVSRMYYKNVRDIIEETRLNRK